MRVSLGILASLAWLGIAQADPIPLSVQPVNTPLPGCVEGRALRIISGVTGCAPASPPTLTACGTSPSLSANATDFVGKITTGTGLLTSCTLVLSKLYTNPGMGCIAQTNSGTALATTPTVGTNGTTTTVVIPITAAIAGATITYVCFPV